jgi:hypothetical protein
LPSLTTHLVARTVDEQPNSRAVPRGQRDLQVTTVGKVAELRPTPL